MTTPTKAQYDTGTAAAMAVLSREIKAYVPTMFQSRIPADDIMALSAQIAKAVLDSVAGE